MNTKARLAIARPCPNWINRLEGEIGLVRRPGEGRALVWKIAARKK